MRQGFNPSDGTFYLVHLARALASSATNPPTPPTPPPTPPTEQFITARGVLPVASPPTIPPLTDAPLVYTLTGALPGDFIIATPSPSVGGTVAGVIVGTAVCIFPDLVQLDLVNGVQGSPPADVSALAFDLVAIRTTT